MPVNKSYVLEGRVVSAKLVPSPNSNNPQMVFMVKNGQVKPSEFAMFIDPKDAMIMKTVINFLVGENIRCELEYLKIPNLESIHGENHGEYKKITMTSGRYNRASLDYSFIYS